MNLVSIDRVAKNVKETPLFTDVTFGIDSGEKIGFVGSNGSGKTTFLDIIAGRQGCDSGAVDCGANTVFGYFDQTAKFVDRSLTVLEYIRAKAQNVTLKDGSVCSAEQFLERFLFPREMFNQKLSYLSGGELRRLQLVRILASAPNFLLFDEPTNDFDIETISLLEDFLNDFEGCVIAVSHDRAFLDSISDFLFVFDGEGGIERFAGGYADYRAFRSGRQNPPEASAAKAGKAAGAGGAASGAPSAAAEAPAASSAQSASAQAKKRKLTYKERQEFDALLDEISALEDEKAALESFFAGPDFAKGGGESAQKQRRYAELSELIQAKTTRWEELSEYA